MREGFCFTVNRVGRYTSEDEPPLRHLRDNFHLHSVKDGCSKGARGTCIIVMDGKAVKSYVLITKRAVGKNIITTEGLSDTEERASVHAFGAMGSMQCGFCTSGMVMAGKVLIDRVPDPTEEETRVALKGSIRHCTGYKRIIEGIQLTVTILRGNARIEESLEKRGEYGVGKCAFRLDAREKVLGYDEYLDGMVMGEIIHVSVVHSRYPWARVLGINCEKTAALPSVLAVLTVEDVPNDKVGYLQQDQDVMTVKGDTTQCVGDTICLVVAESRDILEKAKRTVKIDYEELEPMHSVQEAMTEDVSKAHERENLCQGRYATRGGIGKALENSRYVVTQTYRTPFTEHAFLKPECAVVFPYKDGAKVYSIGRGAYDTRKEVSIMLDWNPDRVVVENRLVGGGFGGKEDVSTQHIAVLTAFKAQRPVKVVFPRQESLSFHPKCHAMGGTFTLRYDENGISTGLDYEIYFNTETHASLCGPVPERAYTRSVGSYCCQNTDTRGFGYYANSPPADAFRGFGVCQSELALESNINLLVEKAGISPWEIRYRNAIESGKVLPNGQIVDCPIALKEALLAVKDAYESNPGRAGIACTVENVGVGVGFPDRGRAKLAVHDGKIKLYSVASDVEQGCTTISVQMVSEATGLEKELIRNTGANSEVVPDSGTTSSSRQTLITGEAIGTAAADLGEVLQEVRGGLSQLEGREFFAEFLDPTDKLGADVPNPKSYVAYGFATHVVVLDDGSRIREVYAAHDSGEVVNPISIRRQIEDGILMGLGYVLTEDFLLKNDVPQAKYGTLGLVHSAQIPGTHAIYVEKGELSSFAYGAKGTGKIATMSTALAAQGAHYTKDHILRIALPMGDTYYPKRK